MEKLTVIAASAAELEEKASRRVVESINFVDDVLVNKALKQTFQRGRRSHAPVLPRCHSGNSVVAVQLEDLFEFNELRPPGVRAGKATVKGIPALVWQQNHTKPGRRARYR